MLPKGRAVLPAALPRRRLPHHHCEVDLRHAGGVGCHAGLQAQTRQRPPHNGAGQHQIVCCKLCFGDGRRQRLAHLRRAEREGERQQVVASAWRAFSVAPQNWRAHLNLSSRAGAHWLRQRHSSGRAAAAARWPTCGGIWFWLSRVSHRNCVSRSTKVPLRGGKRVRAHHG